MIWVVSLSSTDLIARRLTPALRNTGIRSLVGFGKLVGPLVHPVLYHQRLSYARLVLKLFRGEPAISEFDWSFAPTHSSSKSFSTGTGSVLHRFLHLLQPGHG